MKARRAGNRRELGRALAVALFSLALLTTACDDDTGRGTPGDQQRPPATTERPPTAGHQCEAGDARRYDVCRDHQDWIDEQREYAECVQGGGTWNARTQQCDE